MDEQIYKSLTHERIGTARNIRVEDFSEVERRLMDALMVTSVLSLCEAIGIPIGSYYRYRMLKEVPTDWLFKLVWSYSINPYYILYGEASSKYLRASNTPGVR